MRWRPPGIAIVLAALLCTLLPLPCAGGDAIGVGLNAQGHSINNARTPSYAASSAGMHHEASGSAPGRRLHADGRRPRIFVYDLPKSLSKGMFHKDNFDMDSAGLYGLEVFLPKVLRDSPYVTTNAAEADYFYVPATFYGNEVVAFTQQLLEVRICVHL